jgi:peptide/nickel transport system ATP-binding protein
MLMAAVPSLVPRHRAPAAAGRPPVLEAKALSKSYRGHGWFRRAATVTAARDVSITLARGETLGIVGESGSGKSTLARCVSRLIVPSAGSILLDGIDIAFMSARELRPLRRRVQIIFQDPYRSLNPRRDVGASIIEGPMNYGLSRSEALARARKLLGLVGLEPQALDRYPHEFSGGQRQRICIARALAMEPELLIADEAVSALDVSVQAQVLALLDDIKTRLDLALLFITHDLRVAAQVCDRIAVMRQGEIVESGSVAQIFDEPRHAYTRALFAAAPGRGWIFGPEGARRQPS